jgi:hypothetical protein
VVFMLGYTSSTTSWGIVLQKLIIAQLAKKFPVFYETLRFIIVFIKARQWTLSSASLIQSILTQICLRSILILSSNLHPQVVLTICLRCRKHLILTQHGDMYYVRRVTTAFFFSHVTILPHPPYPHIAQIFCPRETW